MTTNTSKNNGLIVGAIFTVCSFLLTFTFVVPIISVLPAAVFESISEAIVSNTPYSNVGKLTILLLTIVLFLIVILAIVYIRRRTPINKPLSKGRLTLLMFAFYFIVHPLFFYIYWGLNFNFRSDGQAAFSVLYTFPFSSFSFILFGLLIDMARNTAANKVLPKAGLNGFD